MPFATESQVNSTLKPYYPDLIDLIYQAHYDWAQSPFSASMQDPKVRATLIWNQFLARAKKTFEGREGISVQVMRHWQGLVVGNSFFVRMKKGTNQLLSRNYPTQAALDFNDASVDLFEGVVRLELVYTLNDLQTEVDRIVIAQRHRSKLLWSIDLLDSAEDHGQSVISLPKQPTGGTPAERMIKPKKPTEESQVKREANDGRT
ncbi:MAG: hypothetical protein KIT86_03540 [Hydrogenophaga sp.]|uniref:hypothetical protein n=1 Tax=Hydrogenophaga sp. TaxID=1904254 RepID=UPI00261F06D9|nr:hypothetical protein [Hydrogenophaga sp.]MCW5668709.1 hypothetical protein [Hydrogenophaga sp.]